MKVCRAPKMTIVKKTTVWRRKVRMVCLVNLIMNRRKLVRVDKMVYG